MLTRLAVAIVCCGPAVCRAQEAAPKVDFQKQIAPILLERCISCHGPAEQKGDLRLDTKEHTFAARDGDVQTIVPGKAADSELVRRIGLPADDDDVMPAKGGPLTAEQQQLVQRWVAEGADWPAAGDAFVAKELAARVLPKIKFELPAIDDTQRAIIERHVRWLREQGVLVQTVAADTDALEVNLSLLREKATDELLAGIEHVAPRLVWLDVSRTAITDKSAAELAKLPQLRRLQAANTKLGDAAFAALAPLLHLEHVNAYGTALGDTGLAALAKLPKLERVYAWQTKVTPDGAKAARAAAPKLQVDLGDYAGSRIDAAQREIAERTAREKPVNDTCPVADKPADAAFTLVHEGRRIGFCCAKCRAAFEKDPAKYAAKLPAKQ